MRNSFRYFLLGLIFFSPAFLRASSALPVDPIYRLFDDESDRMIINQPPLELDPISLGFDASSEKRMKKFLNPPLVEKSISSIADHLSPEDLKVPAPASDLSSNEVKEKDGLSFKLASDQIFDKTDPLVLTSRGESLLAGVGEIVGRTPLQPVFISVLAADVSKAKKQAERVSAMLADLLMRNPDEFLLQFQGDAQAPASIKIQIVGMRP